VDAVIDGVDGILVPVGDVVALAKALERVLNDKALAASMGRAGRKRVLREFQQERIWSEMIKEYSTLLRKKGLWLPEKSTPASMPNLVSDREAIGS
jgi:glycosyltransferase involved in cell wall biosynthesis